MYDMYDMYVCTYAMMARRMVLCIIWAVLGLVCLPFVLR